MQRRAAAIYAAFFLVIGAVSYSLVATAEEPHVEFEDPAFELSQGETFTIDGQQYNVSEVTASSGGGGGGGHGGGGGGLTRSATITWVNQSSQYSETWENNSSVALQGTNYTVVVPNTSDPNQFTLREELNETAVLQEDPQADDSVITRNGTRYVAIDRGEGNVTLVPAEEYFPDPETRTIQEGSTIEYQGNRTTVQQVNESVTLTWTAPRENSVDVESGGNATLGGQQYVANLPDNSTLQLSRDYDNYQRQTREIAEFQERRNGLWGIVILSGVTMVLLVAMAYLPSRY